MNDLSQLPGPSFPAPVPIIFTPSSSIEIDTQLYRALECLNMARSEFEAAYHRLKDEDTEYVYECIHAEFMKEMEAVILHVATLVGSKAAADVRRKCSG